LKVTVDAVNFHQLKLFPLVIVRSLKKNYSRANCYGSNNRYS
jgi:hypothetical protein